MNKKGQFGIITIVGIILAIIIIALFLFSPRLRLIIGGVGLIIFAVIMALKYSKNQRVKTFIILTMFLGGILLVFVFPSFSQSILSPPVQTTLQNGQVFWVMSNVVGNVDEGFSLRYSSLNTNDYVFSDGTEIQPQKNMEIFLSKGESRCQYNLIKTSSPVYYNLLGSRVKLFDLEYWELGNPSRTATVIVRDSNGKQATLNGASFGSQVTLTDPDGNGQVTVQAQGILSGVEDCPGYSDVAMYVDGDGFTRLVSKSSLRDEISSSNNLITFVTLLNRLDNNLPENTAFISGFDNYPDSNPLQGWLRGNTDFGNAVVTLTADAGYFNSITYIPPKEADPVIKDINYQSQAEIGSNSGLQLVIENRGDGTGTVNVQTTTNNCAISPISKTLNLNNIVYSSFIISHGSSESTCSIEFEACSTNQFGQNKCDVESISINQIDSTPREYCGDGTCQSGETSSNCASDCRGIEDCGNGIDDDNDGFTDLDDPECKTAVCDWYEQVVPAGTIEDCGALGWKKLVPLVQCETRTFEASCKTADWILYAIIGVVILGLGTAFILTSKPKRKRR